MAEAMRTEEQQDMLEEHITEEQFPDLYCPVCLRLFDKPITLACGHTVCWECLSALDAQICRQNHQAMLDMERGLKRELECLRCPSGCDQPVPPREQWKPSVQLQSTIDALGRSLQDTMKETHKDNRDLKSQVTKISNQVKAGPGVTHKIKASIIGQSGAGKSALGERWLSGQFNEDLAPTIGATLRTKQPWDDLPVEFDIWDTAGQKRYQNLAPTYMRGAKALIWVVDLTTPDALACDQQLLTRVLGAAQSDTPVMILANKLDLFRKLKPEEQQHIHRNMDALVRFTFEFMTKLHGGKPSVSYMEVSAVTGENVRQAFEKILLETALMDLRNKHSGGGGAKQVRLGNERNARKEPKCCS